LQIDAVACGLQSAGKAAGRWQAVESHVQWLVAMWLRRQFSTGWWPVVTIWLACCMVDPGSSLEAHQQYDMLPAGCNVGF
jgi:hypothetical protein